MVKFYISNIRANIGKSTGRSTHPVESSSGEEWQFYISTLQLILVDQLADLPPTVESSHGQFYISNIRANIGRSTGRIHPLQVESCCGEEWQFYISTIRANTGRSTGRSIPQ